MSTPIPLLEALHKGASKYKVEPVCPISTTSSLCLMKGDSWIITILFVAAIAGETIPVVTNNAIIAVPKIIVRANPMFLLSLGSIVIGVLTIESALSRITQNDNTNNVLME